MVWSDWTWFPIGIPSVLDIEETLHDLIRDVFDKKEIDDPEIAQTGGFKVTRYPDNEVEIEFIVEYTTFTIE